MSLVLEAESLEYVRVPVASDLTDISGDVVELAFTNGAAPQSGDWNSATWDGTAARVLVGPGGDVTLAVGVYLIWVRITDNPEIPVLRGGYLTIR